MGNKHPRFNPTRFFESYRYRKSIDDSVYGMLYDFTDPMTMHSVYLRIIEQGLDVLTAKKRFDYHHPNLVHLFNYFQTSGADLKYHIGAKSEKAFEDAVRYDCLIVETFQTDLQEDINYRIGLRQPFTRDEL